jgi:Mg2+/Co2+ transporter CorB
MSFLIPFLSIIFLIIISAFFSASETALIAASKARIHHHSLKGNSNAHLVRQLQHNIGNTVSSLLLCNTLVNISVSSLGTVIAMEVFGEGGVAIVTCLLGIAVVVYAEVIPKILAVSHPEHLALGLAPILRVIIKILSPFTHAIDFFAKIHLKLLGVRLNPKRNSLSAVEELRSAIDLHGEYEDEVKGARMMLRSILDLVDNEVSQVMRHRKYVNMINAEDNPNVIFDQILSSPYSRLPVWKNDPDNITGIIHVKNFLRAIRSHEGKIENLNIQKIATKPWFIPDSTTLFNQLQAFRERHEHFALVVDEYGSWRGIVTLEDIIEQIVGEIIDETDVTIGSIRPQTDGSYLIDGAMPIRELNKQLGWNLPEEIATTVAGLILHKSRQIPKPGQQYTLHNFKFDILRRHRNQITLVRVLALPPLQKPQD